MLCCLVLLVCVDVVIVVVVDVCCSVVVCEMVCVWCLLLVCVGGDVSGVVCDA